MTGSLKISILASIEDSQAKELIVKSISRAQEEKVKYLKIAALKQPKSRLQLLPLDLEQPRPELLVVDHKEPTPDESGEKSGEKPEEPSKGEAKFEHSEEPVGERQPSPPKE